MKYFELIDKLDSKFRPSVPKGTNIRRPGGCSECSTLPKNCGPPNLLKVKTSKASSLISFTSWGFGVISVTLLELLGNEASQCLQLGRLANSDGNLIEEYRTFVANERIILRGTEDLFHLGALFWGGLGRVSIGFAGYAGH